MDLRDAVFPEANLLGNSKSVAKVKSSIVGPVLDPPSACAY